MQTGLYISTLRQVYLQSVNLQDNTQMSIWFGFVMCKIFLMFYGE